MTGFPYNHPTLAGTYDDEQHQRYIDNQRRYNERLREIRAEQARLAEEEAERRKLERRLRGAYARRFAG